MSTLESNDGATGSVPTSEERNGLRGIRRRRRVLLVYNAVGLTAVATLASWKGTNKYAVAAFAGWALGAIVPTLAVLLSRCPRCRRFFHQTDALGNVFARACVNCGLRLDW